MKTLCVTVVLMCCGAVIILIDGLPCSTQERLSHQRHLVVIVGKTGQVYDSISNRFENVYTGPTLHSSLFFFKAKKRQIFSKFCFHSVQICCFIWSFMIVN